MAPRVWLLGAMFATPSPARDCGTVIVPTGVGVADIPGAVATLHPALYTGSIHDFQLMNLLYRPLLWVGPGLRVDRDSSLASAIDVNADDTVFTVTLKPYTWSDGAKVTADDVLYDWSLIQQLGSAYSQSGNGGVPQLIRSIKALDDHHVEFTLTRAVNPEWFEKAGLYQFYALPRHAWSRYSVAQQQSLQSEANFYDVVDGPFRVTDFVLGRHAVFVPNPLYSGHHASIRRLVVNFLQGTDPLEALEAGQLDMASLPFELWRAAASLHDVQRVPTGAALAFGVITPNLKNPIDPFFDDVRVRDAIERAIDQRHIVDAVFHGNAMPQVGLIPSSLPDLLPPDLRRGNSPLSYNPEAARALLDQAGWKVGSDGVRVKNGRRLAFTVLITAGAETRILLMQLVQSDLAKVGITLSIREVEFNQLIARMLGPVTEWEAVFLDYTIQSFPDPLQYFQPGATGNYEHYADPTMDQLLARANGSPGRDGLYAVESYIVMQQPLIFLPDGSFTILARPGIGGIDKFFSPTGNWSPEYLTLSGAMACPRLGHDPHA